MGWEQAGDGADGRQAKWQRRAARLRTLQMLCPLAGLAVLVVALVLGEMVGLGGVAVYSLFCLGCSWGSDAFARMAIRADKEGKRLTPEEEAQQDARVDAAIAAMEREQAAEPARLQRERYARSMGGGVDPTGEHAAGGTPSRAIFGES